VRFAARRGPQGPLRLEPHRGTQVAATLYSIFETIKLNRVDPAAYLLAAVQAAHRSEALLPWQCANNA